MLSKETMCRANPFILKVNKMSYVVILVREYEISSCFFFSTQTLEMEK